MGIKDVDSHKLMYHPERVAGWLQGDIYKPLHAEIGITDKCNHHCSFCTLDWITHGNSEIPSALLGNVLNGLKNHGVESVYYAGEGEPTLHSEFVSIINGTYNMGLKIALSTNGQRYDEFKSRDTLRSLSWIRFSLDTISRKLYSKLHGVSESVLDTVCNNIEDTVKFKKKQKLNVDIGVQVILTEETALKLNELIECMRDIGVDNVQIKPCHNHPSSSHQARMRTELYGHIEDEAKDYETNNFKVVFRSISMERLNVERSYKKCNAFDFYVLINAKGDVVPCNIFYDKPKYIYGNIYKESFHDIWTGERRKEIIRKIEESNHSMCGNYRCRLDVMNRYLERIKNPEKNDEFI